MTQTMHAARTPFVSREKSPGNDPDTSSTKTGAIVYRASQEPYGLLSTA